MPLTVILVFISLTVISLISGIVLMSINNNFYIKHRNKIMIIRIVLQFISFIAAALFL
ncbi:hypothetical protein HL033_03350 [Neoehrlichia mikurensis]|uniref:hypothetical protein n=1 Tax=Neoehrlichia mikurensis TaxID=89586 RepID=UPI001C45F4AB|nr:hypothetical protein [Neoehrlichia mikurensis]QXK91774.1 hypothetical protein IAH97_03345 [Neoehrlichia mikurensis]QXK92987.1 hypothetical protein HUN61_03340 [Neoehrlichia mikurensis]QXK93464.1 hypothetical protein HL033_03350 [Neoehrlichia mikurensis]